jgi:hypothetical protein
LIDLRKIIALILMLGLVFLLGGTSFSAVKSKTAAKAKTTKTKTIARKKYRRAPRWPAGKRPVFPVYKGGNGQINKSAVIVKKPVSEPKPNPPVQKKTPNNMVFFGEMGLGGGTLVLEMGLRRQLNDKWDYCAGVGYGIGNKYGVVVLDLARLNYKREGFTWGGGLTYAMYSAMVAEIPGLSGQLPNKSMLGVELAGLKKIGRLTGRLAYNTALGIRAALIYEF